MTPIRETWTSSDGQHRILWGDCLSILPTLEPGSIDAVVTDPPYNVGLKYGENVDDRKEWYGDWCADWMRLLNKIGPDCIAVSCGMANLGLWASEFRPKWFIAWNKPAAMGRCCIGFNNWEPIALFGKPPKVIADSFTACIVPDDAVEGHPCPKPLRWGLWQVENLTKQSVLDPFAGSCTVAVACARTGRRSISIEIEERYFRIGIERMEREAKRHPLLEPQRLTQGSLL